MLLHFQNTGTIIVVHCWGCHILFRLITLDLHVFGLTFDLICIKHVKLLLNDAGRMTGGV